MPNTFFILLRRLRKPLIVLITVYAISILGFVLIPGQDNDGNPWQMSFFHAFYFVSFMASTIGFGEIPYEFTDAQRMWTMFALYACVIGWLYSIGALLAVLQDPAFRRLRQEYAFQRNVRELHSPFYLVAGYGDTGAILVEALADEEISAVVIDPDEARINELELSDFKRVPLGIVGDAAKPKVLEAAGVLNPNCLGVIALSDSDQVNLLVALTTHLLNPELRFLARADTEEAVANIRSFGHNEVINPFETFAGRLALAFNRPAHYSLFEWMTGVRNKTLRAPGFPEQGHWVICGFGRFGRALYQRLQDSGMSVTVIEVNPAQGMPEHIIQATGTNANTLLQAGIKQATGIVAGTDNDANNLSILMTARELNPEVFIVARQNDRNNSVIFERARFDLLMRRGDVIANKIFALLRTPLVGDFLQLAEDRDEAWAKQLSARIFQLTADEEPYLWEIRVTATAAPALYRACLAESPKNVPLDVLLRSPRDAEVRLAAVPLLLKREGAVLLLPDEDTPLRAEDRILMCATRQISQQIDWVIQHQGVLTYVLTGEVLRGSSWFWRWWNR